MKSSKLFASVLLLTAYFLASSCCLIQEFVFSICPVAQSCCGDESAPQPAGEGDICVMALAKLTPKSLMDEIRDFITACEGAGMKAVYYGPTTNKLRNPFKQIPRHANLSDYACASQRDMDHALRESGVRM